MEVAAFHYDSEMDYSEHGVIGGMTVRCLHCAAAKLSLLPLFSLFQRFIIAIP